MHSPGPAGEEATNDTRRAPRLHLPHLERRRARPHNPAPACRRRGGGCCCGRGVLRIRRARTYSLAKHRLCSISLCLLPVPTHSRGPSPRRHAGAGSPGLRRPSLRHLRGRACQPPGSLQPPRSRCEQQVPRPLRGVRHEQLDLEQGLRTQLFQCAVGGGDARDGELHLPGGRLALRRRCALPLSRRIAGLVPEGTPAQLCHDGRTRAERRTRWSPVPAPARPAMISRPSRTALAASDRPAAPAVPPTAAGCTGTAAHLMGRGSPPSPRRPRRLLHRAAAAPPRRWRSSWGRG